MKSNFTVWLTGLPSAGKTTVAKELLKHIQAYHLDGDVVRKSLCKDLGFTKEDRVENLRRVSILAKTLNDAGLNVVASFIAPYQSVRKEIRKRIVDSSSFVSVYVKCSLQRCMQRDRKGMYKKALKGEIKDFTGVSAPYQAPTGADVIVDTERLSPQQSANKILAYLYEKQLLLQKPLKKTRRKYLTAQKTTTREGKREYQRLYMRDYNKQRTKRFKEMEQKLNTRKASLFIGRFSPFHNGHKYIFDSVLNNGGSIVVAIRDSQDVYTVKQRKMMIETVYRDNPKVKVIIIPDVDKVCVGREVGYQIMAVPELIQTISASNIRREGKYAHIPLEIVEMVKGFDQKR